MKNIKYLVLIPLMVGCSQPSTETAFEELIDSEWSKIVIDNPVYASSMGDLRFNTEWSDSSIQRINDIQSPFYNNQNGQNQTVFNLEMKQPSFNLPNSLTILNKYKKQQQKPDDGNQTNQPADQQNPGQNAQDPNNQNGTPNNFTKPQGGDQIHLSR